MRVTIPKCPPWRGPKLDRSALLEAWREYQARSGQAYREFAGSMVTGGKA